MFTGIIETVGTVTSFERRGELALLGVDAPEISDGVRVGDSVAVNGGCLTITRESGGHFEFQAVRETLARTTLGSRRVGDLVNLEADVIAKHVEKLLGAYAPRPTPNDEEE